jgi:hypothetical protein
MFFFFGDSSIHQFPPHATVVRGRTLATGYKDDGCPAFRCALNLRQREKVVTCIKKIYHRFFMEFSPVPKEISKFGIVASKETAV